MENGYDGRLAEKLSALAVTQHSEQHDQTNPSPNNNDSLFQVMKAVEAAEATIKQQVEDNNRLRLELEKKDQELEKYKLNAPTEQRPYSVGSWNGRDHESSEAHQSVPQTGNQENSLKSMGNSAVADSTSTLVLCQKSKHEAARSNEEIRSGSSKINGTMKVHPGDQGPADSAGFSQLSSPSIRSISPSRHQMEGDYVPRFSLSGQGLIPVAEVNNSNTIWKQDLAVKSREHEEEIIQLQKHLADYSVKAAQMCNEKYVLEKRIAYMRLAFDQQQQDLVDAASKSLSYRQDIIEENIRLTYALQDAQQERSTFVSSLLPLLAEYSLQPSIPDAQSIVSNVKVLFKHLQEKLLLTESRLKESQYQLAPWHSDVTHSNFAPQSSSQSIGAALATSNKNGLELVPQAAYSPRKPPVPTDGQTAADWDLLGRHHSGFGGVMAMNLEADDMGRYSPIVNRDSSAHDMMAPHSVTRGDTHPTRYNEETTNKQVTFREPVSSSEMEDPDGDGNRNERETSSNWSPGSSPYTTTIDDPNLSYSPYLPPVLEEPSSSFSEAADDDPLPAIEGLQISGEAFPGRELQACGYSINGTTSCNFEWVRHLEDGSVNYIEGAKQPNYLVTADDVDLYLAIEVQPLDNRKRKGELVKVFANENKKITCDLEMLNHIEKALHSGHASYKVSLSTRYLDIWEPATLVIKREGYSIKCSGPSGVVVTEKFSPTTTVVIPYGHASEFITIGSDGVENLLQADDSSTDFSCSRDTIVLTLRLFIRKATERRKGKKKGLFF
ncbi:Tripartite motif-containing 29 [Quillaja saponaria]|uniref:Tripartite motif-containing 29 n=1 Tax=Quillaja saponaria TaxID=32244 RepID=A0AAD7PWL9_QUISA|nr:Tripartite motif-containing 29 [Quillaja saponaria]